MANEISPNELQPGDWVLFEGDRDSFLSKAIMRLTDSQVSHAALYMGDGVVAEEITPGLVTTPIEERLNRRSWVMRRRDPHPDLGRVLGTAEDYLDEGEKYAFSTLVLLGLILIYRKLPGGTLFRRAVIRVLKAASLEVFGLIEKYAYKGKVPMVCSQFVYECYAKPSADDGAYRLQLDSPTLLAALPAAAPEGAAQDAPRGALIDELLAYPALESATLDELARRAIPGEATAEDPEVLARELLEALDATPDEPEPEGIDSELYFAGRQFCDVVAPLMSAPPAEGEAAVVGLEAVADERSYFVTPADLLSVSNGWQVGSIPPREEPES